MIFYDMYSYSMTYMCHCILFIYLLRLYPPGFTVTAHCYTAVQHVTLLRCTRYVVTLPRCVALHVYVYVLPVAHVLPRACERACPNVCVLRLRFARFALCLCVFGLTILCCVHMSYIYDDDYTFVHSMMMMMMMMMLLL